MSQTVRPEIHRAIETLQELSELFRLRRRQLAAEVGLTESQWQLLEQVAEEHFMPSLFARERDCSPAVVSRGLRSLVDAGLVASTIGESDARHRVYRLTPRGRGVLRRLRKRREQAIAAVWEPLSERELTAFVRTARAIADRMAPLAAQPPAQDA